MRSGLFFFSEGGKMYELSVKFRRDDFLLSCFLFSFTIVVAEVKIPFFFFHLA